ncbi:unnamed protein product [Brassica oleracea var. botrytis]|uniref:Uncharacterized protein n=3 Tax=Brassica TaxID=3705 RepID=A0A0D3AJU7_BRAOL|nr:unnamed protein product [Brassica napus]VDD19874.1 unnamed protein product [Brassica oleracea]
MNQDLYGYEDLSTFEDYFRLNQDFPEAEETTFSNLLFQFKVLYKKWRMKVKGCGVQLLEVLQCSIDGKESEDGESMGIMKLKENSLGRDDDNTPVFFQFRGGDWRSGGTCHIETPPDFGASLVPSGHGNIQEKFKDG